MAITNKKERDEKLAEMAKTFTGECLLDYLEEVINDLDTVDKLTNIKELYGRQEAIKILKKVFNFIFSKRGEKIQEKNQYI